ncbi:helix-turn-helix domain-containing protein [Hymenobacter sp. BT770]|uniref:helix-turn-helix domain-containing protein n=1 Tax=Hymenobacter sp. BT770 TaxID=2886942 RepID=UPI001D12C864|nr:helix-turn-helix domain-containing protein [Hymenobacter sp. BT770]MCC3153200.1 helix-turn-helix domain-containing protein [Hymenobacter sp. BT770]MDO3415326.1 helix-turn-helix domain-containing protein [Hymenobacter sp. BT770]
MSPTHASVGRPRPRKELPLPSPVVAPVGQAPLGLPLFLDERHRQVRAFAHLVDQQFRTLKTVSGYAAQLSLSPNHLNALCRRLLHQTASDVLHARIVAEAQRLLTQSVSSVAAIAAALGFADASYFCRYFKKYVRQTPLAFREALSPAHD